MRIDFFSLLDQLLPETIRDSQDQDLLIRARIFVAITSLLILSVAPIAVAMGIVSLLKILVFWEGSISSATGAVIYCWVLYHFRKTGNLQLTANIMIFALTAATTMSLYMIGGWTQPSMILILTIPVCAFIIAGRKSGLAWTLIVTFIIMGFASMFFFDKKTEQRIPPDMIHLLRYFSWLYCWVVLVGAMIMNNVIFTRLNKMLNIEHAELQNKATFDPETFLYTRQAFRNLLIKELERSNRKNHAFVYLFSSIELDDLKNDMERNQVIQTTANLLNANSALKASHFGNGHFAIIMEHPGNTGNILDSLQKLQLHIEHDTTEYQSPQFFIGAVVVPDYTTYRDKLVQAGREALEAAKRGSDTITLLQEKRKIEKDSLLAKMRTTSYADLLTN